MSHAPRGRLMYVGLKVARNLAINKIKSSQKVEENEPIRARTFVEREITYNRKSKATQTNKFDLVFWLRQRYNSGPQFCKTTAL